MAKIICELCGASEMTKDGDFFVCKSCGTNYTLEEAKKLLGKLSKNNSIIDDKSPIDGYCAIVNNAVKVKNYIEAEKYCNKILEVNPIDSNAWLNKGISAGWLSNMQFFRLDEAINCFSNALEFAPSESKEKARTTALQNLQQATINSLNICYNFYCQAPRINAQFTLNFINIITTRIFPYIDEKSSKGEDYTSPIAFSIFNLADCTFNEAWKRHNYRHCCKFDWEIDAIRYDYLFAAEYYVYIVDKYINLKCLSLQQKISGVESIIQTCNTYLENGTLRKDDFWKSLIAKYSVLLHRLSPSATIEKTIQQADKKATQKPKKKAPSTKTSNSQEDKPTTKTFTHNQTKASSKKKAPSTNTSTLQEYKQTTKTHNQTKSKSKKSNPSIIEKLKGWFKN